LRDLGLHRCKDLVEPEHIWQPMVPGLVQTFPPLMSDPNRADRRRDADSACSPTFPRRDFLDGIAIGIGAVVTGSIFGCPAAASEAQNARGPFVGTIHCDQA
jgi:hypothetical protein